MIEDLPLELVLTIQGLSNVPDPTQWVEIFGMASRLKRMELGNSWVVKILFVVACRIRFDFIRVVQHNSSECLAISQAIIPVWRL